MKKIRYVSLCSGYGAECLAFKRLQQAHPDFEFELVAWSEIAKEACLAHDLLHPEYADRNLGDMTKCDYSGIETPIDVLFYSTPCQSVSTAGKNKGMKKGDDAASALIWHTERAISELHPRVCILENVKGMVSKKNRGDFDDWCRLLKSYGYKNFWQIMDASKYGVPQHRERVFMISILRTEADPEPHFNFPKPFPLERRLKHVLLPYGTVPESFYLSDEKVAKILAHCDRKVAEGCGFDRVMQIGNTTENPWRDNPNTGRVYDIDGIAPSLHTCGGGNLEPQILEPQMLKTQRTEEAKELRKVNGDNGVKFADSQEYAIKDDGISKTVTTFAEKELLIAEPVSCAMRGRNPDNSSDRTSGIPTEQRLEMGDNIANCITTVQKDSLIAEPVALGYSRDSKPDKDGKFHTRRHFSDVANTVCASSSGTHEALIAEPTIQPDAIAPTVTTAHEPKVIEPMVSAHPLSHAHENPQPQVDVAPTLRATDYKCPPVAYEPSQWTYRIRKLTPKECFRLMDVDDPDIDKLIEAKDAKGKPALSKSACYKLAGNSIVVSCLFHIFDSLFYGDNTNPYKQLTLF